MSVANVDLYKIGSYAIARLKWCLRFDKIFLLYTQYEYAILELNIRILKKIIILDDL